jgi:L-fuculose-phosphate aldolase
VIAGAGVSEVPVAPYCTFGTEELAKAAIEACGESKAVLLGNHGLVTCGPNLAKAFSLAVNMEFVAEMQYRTRCVGEPSVLTDEQMAEVFERFKTYGQKK